MRPRLQRDHRRTATTAMTGESGAECTQIIVDSYTVLKSIQKATASKIMMNLRLSCHHYLGRNALAHYLNGERDFIMVKSLRP